MRGIWARRLEPAAVAIAVFLPATPAAENKGAGTSDMVAPFWRIGAGFTTKLVINNAIARPLKAEP